MAAAESEVVLRTRGAARTEALAASLARALPAGAVVTLDGELGSGKTCFVRGLARGLGTTEPVSSPTFTLMHEYRGGRLPLLHFDAWMSGREAAFLEDGGVEALLSDGVSVVEWGSRVAAWLPLPRLEVELEHAGPEERRVRIRLALPADGEAGPEWEPLRAALAEAAAAGSSEAGA